MRMRAAFGLILTSLCGSALGQSTVTPPKLFVWQEAPYYWSDSIVMRSTSVTTLYATKDENCVWQDSPNDGAIAARWAVRDIMIGRNYYDPVMNSCSQTSGPVASGDVCLMLIGFGVESASFDSGGSLDPDLPTRFFRPEDAIDISTYPPDPDSSDARSDQPYKHPLLINSGLVPDGNGGFLPAPMREWMEQFCDEWVLIQGDPTRAGLDEYDEVPDPARFYFDAEPIICVPAAKNAVRMLLNASLCSRWTDMELPGDELNRSAADAYSDAATLYGWPSLVSAMDPNKFGFQEKTTGSDGNRQIMAWWGRACQRAQDAVMKHCAYDVIAAHWPLADIRYGNYDDARTDGVTSRTGWMQNPPTPCSTSGNMNKVYEFPRMNLAKLFGSSFWPTDSGGYGGSAGVWLGFDTAAAGTIDMPRLYHFEPDPSWLCSSWSMPGNQQYVQYRPAGLSAIEYTHETALRLGRHTAESSLNSYLGAEGGTVQRLTPWLELAGTNQYGDSYAGYIDKPFSRSMLSMLRAKAMPEAGLWTNVPYSDESDLEDVFGDTQDCARRVYSTRVLSYSRSSEQGSPSHPTYNVNRLEYSLADDDYGGSPARTVDIKSGLQMHVFSPDTYDYKSELTVEFSYADSWPIDNDHNGAYLEIIIECATTRSDTRGIVFIWDWDNSAWVAVQTGDITHTSSGPGGATYPAYAYYTPSLPDGTYENRRYFKHETTYGIADRWAKVDSGVRKTRLKLVQLSTDPFWTYYDLVQLIPAWDYNIEGSGSFMAGPQSDVNYDGQVNGNDLDQFLDEWSDESATADLDFNHTVDETDLDIYVTTYLNES